MTALKNTQFTVRVTCLGRLIVGNLPQDRVFVPRRTQLGFVVDKVKLGGVFRLFRFSRVGIATKLLHNPLLNSFNPPSNHPFITNPILIMAIYSVVK
jgi:hypothetical protein